MRKKLFLISYGFCLASIWGHCFLDHKESNSYTAAMGLSFTFLSLYFLQQHYRFEINLWDKLCLAAFPIVSLTMMYFNLCNDSFFSEPPRNWFFVLFYSHLINPITVAMLVFLLGLTKLKNVSKPASLFVFVYITLFYSYFFHPKWKTSQIATLTENFDDGTGKSSEPAKTTKTYEVDYTASLSDFAFINSSLDTVQLVGTSDKYILLETWNETCPPCIRAMKELPDFYKSIENKVEAYYLYESNKEHVRKKFDKIFSFKSIEDKTRILIDIDQKLSNALKMSGYPYFLLFDSQGKLIYHSRGYIGKEALSKEIKKHIGG